MSEQTRMQVRCDRAQKERWTAAAGGAGNLSEWIRGTLDREAEVSTARLVEFFTDGRWDLASALTRYAEFLTEAVEEGPDGTALGETPDEATAQVAPEGSSSTDVIQVDPVNNPDYVMGPNDEVPRLATQEERTLFGLPALSQMEADRVLSPFKHATVEEEIVGTSGESDSDPRPGEPGGSSSTVESLREMTAEVPAPIQAASLDIVVQRLFPNETTEELIAEYEGTEHDFNDFLGWLTWRHEREEQANVLPDGETIEGIEQEARAHAKNEDDAAALLWPPGGLPHGEHPYDYTDTYKASRWYESPVDHDLDDDTNPEPEDPDDLQAPRMLEADAPTLPPVTHQLSSTCTNAAMHWRLTAGQTCRFCGGTL